MIIGRDMLGGLGGFRVTLLNVVLVSPDDFFRSADEHAKWLTDKETGSKNILANYRTMLTKLGLEEGSVDIKVKIENFQSVAQAILEEALALGAGTIVLGRRGISKKEEFIFGSISNKILHSRKSCAALWVVD